VKPSSPAALRAVAIAVVAAAAAVLTWSAPARADGRTAEKYFDAGEALYKKGRFIDAAEKFEAAYKELAAPEIAFSAAQAYRLGYQADPKPEHVKRAIELYETYVHDAANGPRMADAIAYLESLKKEWRDLVLAGKAKDDAIASDKTQIGVVVPAKVSGATVLIDGVDVSGQDYVDVEPGDRVVRVQADGYTPYEEKVPVARGAQILVRAELEPKPALVKVATEGGVQVHVDGRPVTLNKGVFEAPPGERFVTVTRRGRRPFSKVLDLAPGASVEVDAALRQTDQRRIAKYVLIGSGVLFGLTAGSVTLAVIADSKASGRADDGIATGADADYYNRWRSRRNTARNASYFLGGATVLAAAAALGLYMFDNPAAEAPPIGPESSSTKFTPMVWGDGAGLGVEGAW
jgi:hypothetical protein